MGRFRKTGTCLLSITLLMLSAANLNTAEASASVQSEKRQTFHSVSELGDSMTPAESYFFQKYQEHLQSQRKISKLVEEEEPLTLATTISSSEKYKAEVER